MQKRMSKLLPLQSFDLGSVEFLIKYRTCVFEERPLNHLGEESWIIPRTPGLISLGRLDFLKGPFHTRMVFELCQEKELTSDRHFGRWIKIRNVMFVDSMIFIRDATGNFFHLHFKNGPLYLSLSNGKYYLVMNQLTGRMHEKTRSKFRDLGNFKTQINHG